jgi:hypothetical protein
MLGGFVWFGMTVKLGDKTLFEHLAAIGKSKETHDLVEGTKEAAKPVVHKVEDKIDDRTGVGSPRPRRGKSAGAEAPVGDGGSGHHDNADRKVPRREIQKHKQ